jgi:hypothetical protein
MRNDINKHYNDIPWYYAVPFGVAIFIVWLVVLG